MNKGGESKNYKELQSHLEKYFTRMSTFKCKLNEFLLNHNTCSAGKWQEPRSYLRLIKMNVTSNDNGCKMTEEMK